MKKIAAILCFCGLFSFFSFFSPSETPTLLDGITIWGNDVSGLTKEQVLQKFEPFLEDIKNQKIILVAPDKQKILLTSYKNMGIIHNLEQAIEEGLAQGHQGYFLKRWWEIIKVKVRGYHIPLVLTIDKIRASSEIKQIAKSFTRIPEDARLVVHTNNKIEIKPDIPGLSIDTEQMLINLEEKIKPQGPLSLKIILKEIEANITKQDVENLKIQTLLGQFTTWFQPQQENRSLNIKTAAEALNNFILAPQEEFSFNEIVGPRTKEAGYNDAPIIFNNRFVLGVGGGVCQVSSTLYNVLLRANLPVTERHAHSLPVHYVSKGLDATVVYGFKDLKFINNTPGHILIKSYVWEGNLTIKIFGAKQEEVETELLSIVEKIFSPKTIIKGRENVKKGEIIIEQEGTPGYLVRVERIIRNSKNGEILIHEILSRDYYPPIDKIIVVSNNYP